MRFLTKLYIVLAFIFVIVIYELINPIERVTLDAYVIDGEGKVLSEVYVNHNEWLQMESCLSEANLLANLMPEMNVGVLDFNSRMFLERTLKRETGYVTNNVVVVYRCNRVGKTRP